jgi:TolA-binding protein
MRRSATVIVATLLAGASLRADIILSSAVLNDTLKKMERFKQQTAAGPAQARADALFAFGVEADAFAGLLNDEVAAHGSQEKALIDLGIQRMGELGAAIAYNRDKKTFFYDNAAFREYVATYPRGRHAADSAFMLLQGEYLQSTPTEIEKVAGAAGRKRDFLRTHPGYARNSEVSLMLAVDYRDLFRQYRDANDAVNRDKYLSLARAQLTATTKYRGSEEAEIAADLLRRLAEETAK